MDFYRHRLKHAQWTWRETYSWRQGKILKDRESGRHDKRGARQAARLELLEEAADAWVWLAEQADDFTKCPCADCLSERMRAAYT